MNKLRRAVKNLCDNGFQPASTCSIEGWGAALVAGAAIAGVAGSAISANAQGKAASTAAGAQEQAAQLQANTQAGMYNASQVQNQPARTAGGLALQQEAYLLGLTPNLDISGDTAIAQINPQLGSTGGGVTWTGAGSTSINNALGNPGPNGLPANWGTPAGGSNSQGGYGTINGVPTSSATGPVPTNALSPSAGNNGYGNGGMVGNTINGPGAQLGVGTVNTQPVAPGTAQAQSVNAFRGGTAPVSGGSMGQAQAPGGGPAGSTNPLSGTPNNNTSGYGSLSSVYNPSTFYNDPSYQFEMQQQQLALNKQQAASGGLYSTGALNNALQYAQGLASTDYQNAFNRSQSSQNQQFNYLQALTGGGQVGTNNVGAAGSSAAAGISSAAAGYGNASAAGAIGGANAFSSGVNSATGLVNNALSQYNQGNYGSTPSSNPTNYANGGSGQITNGSTPGTLDLGNGYVINTPT